MCTYLLLGLLHQKPQVVIDTLPSEHDYRRQTYEYRRETTEFQ